MRVLGRLLPVLDNCDVFLLGTGLPAFWVCRMGEMQLTLGLSGWTANDWTRGGSALDQLTPPADPTESTMQAIAEAFRQSPSWSLDALATKTRAAVPVVSAGLNKLALLGQVIHDLAHGVYRWRQVMPVTLSAELIGPENEETAAARAMEEWKVKITADTIGEKNRRVIRATVDGRAEAELTLDADNRIVAGKCGCSYFYTGALRKGPCRHLQAIRNKALGTVRAASTVEGWFKRFAF